MTKAEKILYSIPTIIALFYLGLFFLPNEYTKWLFHPHDKYLLQVFGIFFICILQTYFLIRKLWSFQHINKSKKREWTWILILYSTIASLIFIWIKVDEIENLNTSNER